MPSERAYHQLILIGCRAGVDSHPWQSITFFIFEAGLPLIFKVGFGELPCQHDLEPCGKPASVRHRGDDPGLGLGDCGLRS